MCVSQFCYVDQHLAKHRLILKACTNAGASNVRISSIIHFFCLPLFELLFIVHSHGMLSKVCRAFMLSLVLLPVNLMSMLSQVLLPVNLMSMLSLVLLPMNLMSVLSQVLLPVNLMSMLSQVLLPVNLMSISVVNNRAKRNIVRNILTVVTMGHVTEYA